LSASDRPVPVPDAVSGEFWAATAAHVLELARCARCANFVHPPETPCPNCRSTDPDFRFEQIDGSGTIRSWTVMRQSFLPGFDVPFVLVDVELSAQAELRLIGRLIDGPDTPLRQGAPVRMVYEDIAPGVSIPAFELQGAT
jgi:uncharacterized OB-fold protein